MDNSSSHVESRWRTQLRNRIIQASSLLEILLSGLVLIGLLLSIPGPCIRTMLMNVNKPHCRSTVIAISEVFNNVGRILGPVLFVYFCR